METLICSMTHRVSQIAQMIMNLPGDLGLIPGLGRCLEEGNGNPLQYSCLENSMDREAWQATAYGIAKSWTRLDRLTHTYIHTYMTHKRRIDVKAGFDYRYWDACPGWMVFVISKRVIALALAGKNTFSSPYSFSSLRKCLFMSHDSLPAPGCLGWIS